MRLQLEHGSQLRVCCMMVQAPEEVILPISRLLLPLCQHKHLQSHMVMGIKEPGPQKDWFLTHFSSLLCTHTARKGNGETWGGHSYFCKQHWLQGSRLHHLVPSGAELLLVIWDKKIIGFSQTSMFVLFAGGHRSLGAAGVNACVITSNSSVESEVA